MSILTTNRLVLRPFLPEDWEDLYAYLSNEKTVQYQPYGPFTKAQAKAEAVCRSQNNAFWAITLKTTGRLIGHLYLAPKEPVRFGTSELGYVLHPDFEHAGYATEACIALINHAFESPAIRRITAECNVLNTSSWKLLERLTFTREAHLRAHAYFKVTKKHQPIWIDSYIYGLLKEEWLLK